MVYSSKGMIISPELYDEMSITTGMELRLMKNGVNLLTTAIAVTGDVDGDGKVGVVDLVYIKRHMLTSTLTGVYLKAAETGDDNNITAKDIIEIKKIILSMK